MTRVPLLYLSLLAVAALALAVSPGLAAEQKNAVETARGTVQSVAADQNQIVVKDKDNKEWTYDVLKDATIFGADEGNGKLADLKTGDEVSLLWQKKGDKYEACAILPRKGAFQKTDLTAGKIKRVSADANELMVTDSGGRETTYQINDKARIQLNNRAVKLADFKAGDPVVIAYDRDGDKYMVKCICNHPGRAR